MRIGVVGDTHNRMSNVDRIVMLFQEARVDRVVHTGDITQPKVLERFATLDVPLLGVYGNNDRGERARLESEARRFGMDLADPPRSIEWAGRRIMIVHDPTEAPDALPAGLDLILHGHTHRPAVHHFTVDQNHATRIVLGDWYEQGSLVRWDNNGFSLDRLAR